MMSGATHHQFIFCIVLAVLFTCGVAIRCFQCRNETEDCNDGQCEGAMCYKRTYHYDNETMYEKGCAPDGTEECVSSKMVETFHAIQCRCRTDWCNR